MLVLVLVREWSMGAGVWGKAWTCVKVGTPCHSAKMLGYDGAGRYRRGPRRLWKGRDVLMRRARGSARFAIWA